MKITKCYLSLFILILVLSCGQNPFVGIGNSVDTEAPRVTFNTHKDFEYVSGNFTLGGECFDNLKVTLVTLKIEQNDKVLLTEKAVIKGNKWSVDIATSSDGINGLADGEYRFNVFVSDAMGNSSRESFKMLTLIVDNKLPGLHLTYPPVKPKSFLETVDEYNIDSSQYLQNGRFYIQGWSEDEYAVKNIQISLIDEEGHNVVTKVIDSTIANPVGVEGSVWSWKFYFEYGVDINVERDTRYYYRVYIKTTDAAGNIEEGDKGLICVYQKSDDPYSLLSDIQVQVPVRSLIAGNTYDDDGLKKIFVRIAPKGLPTVSYTEIREAYSTETIVEKIFTLRDPLQSFTWSLEAPVMPGAYTLYVAAQDIFETVFEDFTSEYCVKDFAVRDDAAPILNIDGFGTPNSIGDFALSGNFYDKAGVAKGYVAWVPQSVSGSFLTQSVWNQAILDDLTSKGGVFHSVSINNVYDPSTDMQKSQWDINLNIYDDFKDEYDDKKIYVYAENTSGKVTSELVIMPKDDKVPEISILTPLDGANFTTSGGLTFNVSGTVSDDSRITIFKVQGVTVVPKSDGTWDIESDLLPFADGPITFSVYAKDIFGNEKTVERSIIIDNNNPFITYVTSENNPGAYNEGSSIIISVHTNKNVTVTGTPYISLNSAVGSKANYKVGSGTTKLSFEYIVLPGDTVSNLNYNATDSFILNGASIKDSVNVDLNKTLPMGAGALGNNISIEIDTTKPFVDKITSSNPNGTYKAADSIMINLVCSENVFVTGTPELILSNGKKAIYNSGNGSSILTFKYIIQTGDNVSLLNVSSLNLNGGTISDNAKNYFTITLPTAEGTTLATNKTITIDTIKPKILSINSTNSNGSYKEGETISITVSFDEPVFVTATPEISLSSGITAKAIYSTGNGGNVLTFSYSILTSQNSADLTASSITGNITDEAGNSASLTLPTSSNLANNKNIVIDTTKPSTPTVSGVSNNGLYNNTQTITVALLESDGEYRYELNGVWSSWTANGGVTKTITINKIADTYKEYTFRVMQRDKAGNESNSSTEITFVIDSTELKLLGISSLTSSGLYTVGKVIDVILSFNKPVKTDGEVSVSLNCGYSITIDSTSLNNSYSKSFTVKKGENTSKLSVTSVTGTFYDRAENTLKNPSLVGKNLDDSKNIVIDTQEPTLTSTTLTNIDTLKFELNFSEPVFKNSGVITLSRRTNGFPVVLDDAEYIEWLSKISSLNTYYTYTSLGADSSGNPDNAGKYVLKFSYESNNAALISLFNNAGFNKHEIPIDSSQITISGDKVTISPTAKLIDGVEYTLSIPDSAFKDAVSLSYAGDSNVEIFVRGDKCASPIIRVNKQTGNGNTQPQQTTFKISSYTAGSTLQYNSNSSSYNATPSTEYSSAVTIGSNDYNGGIYYITATASKSGLTTSTLSYEKAYKTVLKVGSLTGDDGTMYLFRGGDSPSGAVGTPGFPFSWDTSDYNGIKLANKTDKALVTWGVNVKVYFHPLIGKETWTEALGPQYWKWRESDPEEVEAGGTKIAGGKIEGNWHNR